MSSNFVQFNFPCKDCLVLAACKNTPKNNESIKYLYDNDAPRCLAVPKLPLDITYHKGILECWANLGVMFVNGLQLSENPKTCREMHNNIPMQYVSMLGHMSGLIQWIVNSTSWEKGILQDFDKVEVNLKAKHCRV